MGALDTRRVDGPWGSGRGQGLGQAVGWVERLWEQAVGTLPVREGQ